jgi:hypothetical protein
MMHMDARDPQKSTFPDKSRNQMCLQLQEAVERDGAVCLGEVT